MVTENSLNFLACNTDGGLCLRDVLGGDRGVTESSEGQDMSLREALLIALRAVRAHRLRSALTMLGLIIGVSAVILLVAIGDGVQKSVDARIEPLANLITIVPTAGDVPGNTPKNLIDADVAALQKAPDILAVTPVVTGPSLIKTGITQLTTQSRVTVIGSTEH
jgi:putative ABC transport system permease protein